MRNPAPCEVSKLESEQDSRHVPTLTSHYYFPGDPKWDRDFGSETLEDLSRYFHAAQIPISNSAGPLTDCSCSGHYVFVLTNQSRELPASFWQRNDVAYIAPVDALYTFPRWDWWIEPLLPRSTFGNKNAHLILTDYLTPENVSDFRSQLLGTGVHCLWVENLDAPRNVFSPFLSSFRDVLLKEMPLKLAAELNRIRTLIHSKQFDSCVFLLRGGFFIRKILENFKLSSDFHFLNLQTDIEISHKFGNPSRTLFIDDAIGMARSLLKILERRPGLPLHFASLDAAFPLTCYQRSFPSVNFYLPSSKLNIYGCRLFEDNPAICGVDIDRQGQMQIFESTVRNKFMARILEVMNSTALLPLESTEQVLRHAAVLNATPHRF